MVGPGVRTRDDGPVGWVLNLDAEFELIDPEHRPSPRLAATVRALAGRVVRAIEATTGRTPWVVAPAGVARGTRPPTRGEAWCPTPNALAILDAAGLERPDAPPPEVLRTVNHRAFAAELADPDEFPGAVFCRTVDEVHRAFAHAPGSAWLLKRPLGFSGRMRKVVRPTDLDAAGATWIAASMDGYGCGLAVEPLVERLLEGALHGRVDRDGRIALGRPVVCHYDDDGAWRDARRAERDDWTPDETRSLEATAERVGRALGAAGYVGPFGVDAFRWRAGRSARLRTLVEINARHTMSSWWGAVPGPV